MIWGVLLVFWCDGGKGHAVSAKLVSLLTRSNFLFLCLKPKKNNSLHHWNTLKRPAKRTACTLIRTLKQVFVLIKLSTHTHSKHKVNAHIHTLLSTRHRTFSVFQTQLDELMGTCLLLSFDRLKTALQTGLSIYPSNTHLIQASADQESQERTRFFHRLAMFVWHFSETFFQTHLGLKWFFRVEWNFSLYCETAAVKWLWYVQKNQITCKFTFQ